ncbi:MAG: MBL fold metallo-hydrolase [Deltaproteobacteria bacterium]|nr:MBL fold metallo-hydrolase [Deltaproteobacteria bacterium]
MPNPARLFYRRALGLEVRVRPEVSWAEAEISAPGRAFERTSLESLRLVGAASDWKSPEELGEKPARLWDLVERGWLYYASAGSNEAPGKKPRLRLSGSAVDPTRSVARRAAAWPTLAVETAVEITHVPFMPRARDLAAAHVVGLRFDCRERGRSVFGITVSGGDLTGRVCRALIPLLDRGTSLEDLGAEIRGDAAAFARRLLELLAGLGVLEPTPRKMDPARAPQLTWLGHAAILFQTERKNVLVDPLFFAPSEPPEPCPSHPRFDPRTLPPIDAVLITHGDNDHLNPSALTQLPSSTPVVVPRLSQPPLEHQVDIAGLLALLGFEQVIELDRFDTLELGDLKITACPFVGEDWGLPLPQATFLLEAPGFRVFASSDANEMDDAYERIGSLGTVDLALMGVSGNAEAAASPPELGYGNFYRDHIPTVRHQEWMEHCAGPAEAARSLEILKPRFAFGYAAGGTSYIDTMVGDRGSHAELAQLLAGSAVRPVDLPLGVPVTREALDRLAEPARGQFRDEPAKLG